jgi:hypothetical protein
VELEFFLGAFSKNTQISNLMQIRSMGAVLFHAEGQTDLTKPIVTFSNFANAPKKTGASLKIVSP